MKKTRIEWCDSTWNPVTGCNHGCEYCYARGIARRFGGIYSDWFRRNINLDNPDAVAHWGQPIAINEPKEYKTKKGKIISAPYPFGFLPTLHRYRLGEMARKKKPHTIFVGSMCDLFGEWVPDEWIEEVFAACAAAPQHRYLFLTKNSSRYIDLYSKDILPDGDNYWFGSTTTTQEQRFWWSELHNAFVSIEPMLGPFDKFNTAPERFPDWTIIGAMSGPGAKKHRPKREWIEAILEENHKLGRPVFMKNSLARIWGEPLIQEYPWDN